MNQLADVSAFRSLGPRGLDSWIQQRGAGACREIDQVCRQKDAHTALLYWYTELPAAMEEAKRSGKPILSLRLLGNLDEERSCANSRFFRKMLYPDAGVNRMLRERFVLHWESVRPVPVITIDFGGGKKIEKTITGNSVHLVLDGDGRPVDALPGLMQPQTFARKLEQALVLAKAKRRDLPRLHEELLAPPAPRQPMAQPMPYGPPQMAYGPPPMAPPMQLQQAFPGPPPSRAVAASSIAMSKHMVEMPLLRAASPLEQDDRKNQELHERLRQAFASFGAWDEIEPFVEWIYAELFLMPLSDPALGLDVPDPFDAPPSAPRDTPPGPPPGNPQASVGQPTLPAQAPPVSPPSKMQRLMWSLARAFAY